MHFYFILASCPSVTSSYQRPPIQSRPPLMELFVFLRYGPLEPCLKSSAIPSVLFRLHRSAIYAPPSRELDSVPLRLDPTCHQDASLRIRPIQCVRLSAVWFCFLPPWFPSLRSTLSLSSSANVLFFQVSQSRRHEYKRRIKTGRGAAALFYYYSVCILPFCSRFEVLGRSAPAATSCWIPDSHIQPTHPLAFFFCRLWFFHKFLQIASLISQSS